MILPLRTDSPLRSTPYMNWALIFANVIMFIVQHALWRDQQPYALQPRNPQLIGYITYQFLHQDILHLVGNMLFLYIFGNNVNDRMGNWGYLGFYLAGGVAAGIGHMLSSPASVIGASGSIAAVTGAYLVLLPRSHITLAYWFIFIGIIEVPSVLFIVMNIGWDVVLGFGEGGGNVAHTAHLSGYLFGFIVCFSLLAVQMLPRNQFDLFALAQRWNRRRQYQDMVRQGFDPFAVAAKVTNSAPDPKLDRIQDVRAQIAEALSNHQVADAARFYLELHAIDPQQVLSRQNQLDVANQLFAEDIHGAAADAYEGFIKVYPKYDQIEQVQLMLGLLYARYLARPDRAREHLEAALKRLSGQREIELARGELARIEGHPHGA